MQASLLERFRRGDRLALSRLITLISRGEHVESILRGIGSPAHPSRVVALTGPGGVGKSSLTGKLLEVIRREELKVAVLACDPESPLSGGALLGDRFRMSVRPDDEGVFIRSLAAGGGQGALARHLEALVQLLSVYGFDVILIETVGAGQGDTAVRSLVDVLVLLLQPETGDDLQWEKAGLLEVADLIAIHKADLPGADRVEAQVLSALTLTTMNAPAIIRVSSRTGEGVKELWQAIAHVPLRRGVHRDAEELYRLLREWLNARYETVRRRPETTALVQLWQQSELDTSSALRQLLDLMLQYPTEEFE